MELIKRTCLKLATIEEKEVKDLAPSKNSPRPYVPLNSVEGLTKECLLIQVLQLLVCH